VAKAVRRGARRRTSRAVDGDDAFVSVLIAAMEASGHVSASEAERAHQIIWSTRRFRNRSGDAVGRRIERMRELVRDQGIDALVELAARQLPKRERLPAYAIAADIALVDGRMERAEAKFLHDLAARFEIDPDVSGIVLDVIRLKNSA
jgi:tellurite resistance protein